MGLGGGPLSWGGCVGYQATVARVDFSLTHRWQPSPCCEPEDQFVVGDERIEDQAAIRLGRETHDPAFEFGGIPEWNVDDPKGQCLCRGLDRWQVTADNRSR